MTSPTLPVLRIGFIGSGFMARFHLQSLTGVRNAVVTGVFSTTAARREAFAAEADRLDLGPCRPYGSIEAMLASGEVDAVWIANPNYARLEAMEEIHRLVKAGRTPCAPSPARSRSPARSATRGACSRWCRIAGCCTATWRTSCSRPRCSAGTRSSGAGRCRTAAAPTGARRRGA